VKAWKEGRKREREREYLRGKAPRKMSAINTQCTAAAAAAAAAVAKLSFGSVRQARPWDFGFGAGEKSPSAFKD